MKTLTLFVAFVAIAAFAPPALAQTPPPSQNQTKFKKRTIIEFDGVLLEVDIVKPTGGVIHVRPGSKFEHGILVRTDFDAELLGSAGDL